MNFLKKLVLSSCLLFCICSVTAYAATPLMDYYGLSICSKPSIQSFVANKPIAVDLHHRTSMWKEGSPDNYFVVWFQRKTIWGWSDYDKSTKILKFKGIGSTKKAFWLNETGNYRLYFWCETGRADINGKVVPQ